MRFSEQRAPERAFDCDGKIIVRFGKRLRLARTGAAVADVNSRDRAVRPDDGAAGTAGAPTAINRKLANAIGCGLDDAADRTVFGAELSRPTISSGAQRDRAQL